MSERARALEQALRMLIDAAVQTACKIAEDGDRRWHVVDLVCATNDAEKLLAVDPPPSGASPQAEELRAANVANLREMVGMAGRHREALLAVRECILALSPGHRTGYDWNADPLFLTLKEGRALNLIDDAMKATPASLQAETSAADQLTADDVEWIVNDNAELGVKIRQQFFFCYKGHSLVYDTGAHDDGTPMMWRPVFKREFGECIHPVNYTNPTNIGTVSRADSDQWKPLPAPVSPVEPEPPTEAQFGEYERLKRQAREIEKALREAGCPAMPLEQGVRWLANKDFTAPLPPRPPAVVKPHRYDLVRYGVTWEGQDNQPLLTPMPDGYWTPWHLAVEAPTVEPEPCVWRADWREGRDGSILVPSCQPEMEIDAAFVQECVKLHGWKFCTHCGAPLKVEKP